MQRPRGKRVSYSRTASVRTGNPRAAGVGSGPQVPHSCMTSCILLPWPWRGLRCLVRYAGTIGIETERVTWEDLGVVGSRPSIRGRPKALSGRPTWEASLTVGKARRVSTTLS